MVLLHDTIYYLIFYCHLHKWMLPVVMAIKLPEEKTGNEEVCR